MARTFQCSFNSCPKTCDRVFASDMKIVSIFEANNKGKTITLNKLLELLTPSSYRFIAAKGFASYSQFLASVTNQPKKDHTAVFAYTTSNGEEKTLGITTTGDMCYHLARKFSLIEELNGRRACDLYVCASHITGATSDWLIARTIKGLLLRWRKDTTDISINQNHCNQAQANSLLQIVTRLLETT